MLPSETSSVKPVLVRRLTPPTTCILLFLRGIPPPDVDVRGIPVPSLDMSGFSRLCGTAKTSSELLIELLGLDIECSGIGMPEGVDMLVREAGLIEVYSAAPDMLALEEGRTE